MMRWLATHWLLTAAAAAVVALSVSSGGCPPTTQNTPPVASAGTDQTAVVGESVTLDASGSTDADGDTLSFEWTQTAGPAATLSSSSEPQVQVTLPAAGFYDFTVTVADGRGGTDSASVRVAVRDPTHNTPPLASAGADQTAAVGQTVTLDASGSADVDGDALSYQWAQTAGPTATLSNADKQQASATLPAAGVYDFMVTVTDGHGGTGSDSVRVLVSDATQNTPPSGLSQSRVDDRVNVTLAGESVAFLERSAKQPFFLYFTPVAVHNPVTPNKQFRGKAAAGLYGDYVAELDWAVGQVLATLDRLKVTDHTLVLFTSDNGGVVMPYGQGANQQAREFPLNLEDDTDGAVSKHYRRAQAEATEAGHRTVGNLRGRKHSIYEGGFRVPYVVRWPGHTGVGRTSAEVVSLVDTLATCAGILGEPLPRNAAEDSYDVLPAILGRKLEKPIREATVVHSAEGVFAIRQGPWKLIEERTWDDKLRSPWRAEAVNQLYNLASDPEEKNNVWEQNAAVAARLKALLKKYREQGFSRPMA